MFVYNYTTRIGDVRIGIMASRHYDLESLLCPTTEEPEAMLYCHEEPFEDVAFFDGRTLTYIADLCTEQMLILHAFFLVDQVSKQYRYFHASGFRFKGIGFLVIGKGGNGKSTFTNLFHKAQVISDDAILVCDSRMYSGIGKCTLSVRDEKQPGFAKFAIEPNAADGAKINYVLLLDNEKEGGFLKRCNNLIPREMSVPEMVYPGLQDLYLKRGPAPIEADCYQVGTNGNIKGTMAALEQLINK